VVGPPELVEALPPNWHGDPHWKVRDTAGREFSVRAITAGRAQRWEEARPYDLSVVIAQLRVAAAMRDAGVPMMRLVAGPVVEDDRIWLAFEWLTGEFADRADAARATAAGRLLRRLHDARLPFDDALPVHDACRLAARSVAELRAAGVDERFVARAQDISARLVSHRRVVSHGDVNFPNVLWDGDAVTGLVDLDQIGVIDPLEELAWALKWWSRPHGAGLKEHDARLAAAVLHGYGDADVDRDALRDLLWITGCLNANSVNAIIAAPADALPKLEHRADTLADLLATR
jgi:aminoglycoside phosphotransferase